MTLQRLKVNSRRRQTRRLFNVRELLPFQCTRGLRGALELAERESWDCAVPVRGAVTGEAWSNTEASGRTRKKGRAPTRDLTQSAVRSEGTRYGGTRNGMDARGKGLQIHTIVSTHSRFFASIRSSLKRLKDAPARANSVLTCSIVCMTRAVTAGSDERDEAVEAS